MVSGIYAITNTVNGKVYIGSTINFERRWNEHRRALCKSNHENPHLQHSWNKYGEDTFEFSFLEDVDNIENLVKVEQSWMDKYREEGRELYNYGLAVTNPMLGFEYNAEPRRKVSEANMGNQNALGHTVSKEHRRKLSEVNIGNTNTLGCKLSEEHKHKISVGNSKPYPAFINCDTGDIIPAGINLAALCKIRGLCCSGMHLVKLGKSKHCKGWKLLKSLTRGLECM